MVLAPKQTYGSMEQIREFSQLIIDTGGKNIQWIKMTISLSSGIEKVGQRHVN